MGKKRAPITAAAAPRLSSFGDLLRDSGVPVREDIAAPIAAPEASTSPPGSADLSRAGKIVLRRERKGHGGKTVTVIEGLPETAAGMETIARQLRQTLGCGARVDDGRVLLQGDHADGAAAWLRERGARHVIRGN